MLEASVIVTTYRQERTLSYLLTCLAQDQASRRFEVIVVDDGSPVSTWKVIATHAPRLRELRYVWQPNRGYRAGQARNLGIRLARGQVLVFIDADMVPLPGYVEAHVEWHRAHPHRLFSGNRLYCADDDIFPFLGEAPTAAEIRARLQMHIRNSRPKEERNRLAWSRSASPWKAIFAADMSMESADAIEFNPLLVGWGNWRYPSATTGNRRGGRKSRN